MANKRRILKSVFFLYTTDAWHTYTSYELKGVFTSKAKLFSVRFKCQLRIICRSYLRYGYRSAEEMFEYLLNQLQTTNQTQGLETNLAIEEKPVDKLEEL